MPKGKGAMKDVMSKFKHGELHSGSKKGQIVKSKAQAIAIGLHEAGMSKPKRKKR